MFVAKGEDDLGSLKNGLSSRGSGQQSEASIHQHRVPEMELAAPPCYRLLLVEDRESEARLVFEYLASGDGDLFIVEWASDLEEAKEKLKAEPFDALLVDLGLPDSQDMETLAAIFESAPHAATIVLSGNSERSLALQALEHGAQDFILKNKLNEDVLKRTILYAIQRQELRKRLQVARRSADVANKAKSEFLAMMSHELRTPLNGAMGAMQLARKTDSIEECQEYFEVIERGHNALLTMIDQVLDMVELESDQLISNNQHCKTRDLMGVHTKRYSRLAGLKKISFKCEVDASTPETLSINAELLNQALEHLLNNAIKFTEQGDVTLTVGLGGDDALQFEIKDTGVGIDSGFMPRMFEPFTQEDSSATRCYGGAGLGLTAAKRICDVMGWKLECESEKNAGTCFRLFVPLQAGVHSLGFYLPRADYVPKHTEDALRKGHLSESMPLRILMAEDSVSDQKIVAMMLQSLGYTVDIVTNGFEAAKAVEEKEYDCVLMDIAMPNMDGVCAVNVIRYQAMRHKKRLPYLAALTASVAHAQRQKCTDAGMDAFLTKPVKMDELVYVLEEAYARVSK